jgi:hypothetical protein
MLGELMTLPMRAGVRVTRFALHTTLTTAARALTLAGGALQSVTRHDGHAPQAARAPYAPGRRGETVAAKPLASPPPVLDPAPPPIAEALEPPHVSEEPELVAEFAAIQLYESSHKRRETLLNAVTRALRRQGAGAPD